MKTHIISNRMAAAYINIEAAFLACENTFQMIIFQPLAYEIFMPQMLSRSSTLTPASGQLQVMIGTKIELYNKNKSGIIRWLSVLCHSLKEGYVSQSMFRLVEGSSMDKTKALDAALSQIERAFGKGSIMRLGQQKALEIETIPTGSLGLDIALGVGGLPRGRVIEIFGPESSGKTTLALHTVAEAQKIGGVSAFIDAEHALDPIYARKLGVNLDNLLISQPDTGEQALEIADTLVRSGAVDVLVVDSVAALTPKAEIEGDGRGAAWPAGASDESGPAEADRLDFPFEHDGDLHQPIRMKIGVMYGSPETTTGGNALKFYASVRLDIRRIGSIKEREDVVGTRRV